MVKRLNKKHVTFHFPFAIDGVQHVFRRGEYTIETEEESIPGGAVIRFRHVETVLIAHPQDNEDSPTSFWAVDPDEIAKAISNDADQYLKSVRETRKVKEPSDDSSESE